MKKLVSLFFLGLFFGNAQEFRDFSKEVVAIQRRIDTTWNPKIPTLVFTGSSSIRLWDDLQERFPEYQILNTGFGGSLSYDLLGYLDKLVLNYHPNKVFIYEGDNDLFYRRKPKEIISNFVNIIKKIKEKNSNVEIVIISVKPSIARWKLRRKCQKLNEQLKQLAATDSAVAFVNIWDPMLMGRKVNKSLFVEDGLHMNKEGYDIWQEALQIYMH